MREIFVDVLETVWGIFLILGAIGVITVLTGLLVWALGVSHIQLNHIKGWWWK